MNGVYHEFRSYSPIHDCEVGRISVFNERGSEFYMLVPVESPRKYRHARQAALDAIQEAMDRHLEPGQVKISASDFNHAILQIAVAEAQQKRTELLVRGVDPDDQ